MPWYESTVNPAQRVTIKPIVVSSRPEFNGMTAALIHGSASANAIVTMLGVPGALKHKVEGNTLTIETPDLDPDGAPCRYAYLFKTTGAEVADGKLQRREAEDVPPGPLAARHLDIGHLDRSK